MENRPSPTRSPNSGTIGAVLAAVMLAAGTSTAFAETSRITFEASHDGEVWSRTLETEPSRTVYVRMRVTLEGATALGLSGITCAPHLTNWTSGVDEAFPFTFPGLDANGNPVNETTYDGRHVSPNPLTNTGRMFPYGAGGMGVSSSSGLLTPQEVGTSMYFLGTRPPNNGLSLAQNPSALAGTNFNSSLDTVVFRYAVVLNEPGVQHLATVGEINSGTVKWYTNAAGTDVLNSTNIVVEPAEILTIPSPGGAVVLGTVALWTVRRRRATAPASSALIV